MTISERLPELLDACPHCEKPFANRLDQYRHLEKHGCPTMRKMLSEVVAPKCACGCGQQVTASKRDPKRFNKFRPGHNKRR